MDGTQPLADHDVLQPTYEAPAAPADMASQAKHCSRAALHNSSHLAQGAAGGEHFSDGILIAGAERKCGAICRGGGLTLGGSRTSLCLRRAASLLVGTAQGCRKRQKAAAVPIL